MSLSSSSANINSKPSLYSNKAAINYANCRRGAMFLPTPPPSFKQKQQQGRQEYESLEHIYESIDSVKD